MLELLGHLLWAIVARLLIAVLPLGLIYAYVTEPAREYARYYTWALGVWTALFCGIALITSPRDYSWIVFPFMFWAIWIWADLMKEKV